MIQAKSNPSGVRPLGAKHVDGQGDGECEVGVLTIGDNRTQHSVGLVSVRGSAVIRVPGRVNAGPAAVHH